MNRDSLFQTANQWVFSAVLGCLAAAPANAPAAIYIQTNAVWRYLVTATDPGTAWRGSGFDDSVWPSGPAQLGFGEGDEATVLTGMHDGSISIPTAYFRRLFVVPNPAIVTNLTLRLLRDDGAVVYLNGVEVRRDNLPAGPINHFTLATAAVGGVDENTFFVSDIPPSLLVAGTNVMAAEIHQSALTSGDLSFALQLLAGTGPPTNPPPATNYPPVVRLVSPTNGAAFTAPTNLLLVASAYDPGTNGRVMWLEFFANSNLLGRLTNTYGSTLATNFFFEWLNAPTGAHVLTVRATDIQGAASISPPVAIHVLSPSPDLLMGFLRWEVYTGIPGITVSDLTDHPSFPDHPGSSSLLSQFETPGDNIDDNFGARITGFLLPPVTGDYVFYLSSDDQGALFLSSDESPANKVQIALEPTWSPVREWVGTGLGRTNGENISLPIPLEAGRRYYIEALYKEGGGGDHLGVAWQKPGDPVPVNGSPPIPGEFLATYGTEQTNLPTVVTVSVVASGQAIEPTRYATNSTFGQLGLLRLTRAGNVTQPLAVNVQMSGSAINGIDYLTISSPFVFPAGSNAVTVVIDPVIDALIEDDETAVLTIMPGAGYTVGQPAQATITIGDSTYAARQVNVVVTDSHAVETAAGLPNNGAAFTFTVSGDTNRGIVVEYTVNGSASNAVDYETLPGTVFIPAGVHAVIVPITPIDDPLIEVSETVVVTIPSPPCLGFGPPPPWCYEIGPSNQATVFIADNDAVTTNRPPLVSIVTPLDGAVVTLPTNVLIQARAIDSDGMVTQVEFFDGTNSLGIVRLPPIVILNETELGLEPLLPSGLSPFSLIWTNPPPGVRVLWAAATDNLGATAASPALHLVVEARLTLAQALDAPELTWSTGGDAKWTAETSITHDGVDAAQSIVPAMEMQTWLATTVPGPGMVSFQWRILGYPGYDHLTFWVGTNQVGQITTTVEPPAEAPWQSATFTVPPGRQTLRWMHNAPSEPIENYSGAWLDEVQFSSNTDYPPHVIIHRPTNGAIVTLPMNLDIVVLASDPNDGMAPGLVTQVEFLDGTNKLGTIPYSTLVPSNQVIVPLNQPPFVFTWTNPPPGVHALRALATDNGGLRSTSAPITIIVRPGLPDCVAAPSGLVAWWRAENNAIDAVGGNTGNWFNNAMFASGRVGQAFAFDGGSYVEVPDAPSLRLTDELTIEFWVRRDRLDEPHYIVEKGGDWTWGEQNYAVALHTGAYNHCLHFLFAGGWRGGGSIGDTNWHHCAITARNGDADPALYIDGVEQPVVYGEGASTIQLYPSTRALHLGAQIDPQSGWFYYHRGLIDEVSIYSRALSVSEIQAVYHAGSFGKCATTDVRLPVITRQPTNLTRTIGQTAVFSLIATGAPPLRYQWQFNNYTLVGATNSALVISNVQSGHSGNYFAVATNPFGSVTSAVATLTVVTPGSGIPRIFSFTPKTAPAGTPMTIVGTNFSASAALNTVYFGAVKATVISASATVLHVIVPPGATYAPLSVTVNGRTAWARDAFSPTFPGNGVISASSFVTVEEDRSTGDGPVDVVTADLDGDGKPDLAVADRFANTLSLFRNVSVPGMLTPQSFGTRIVMPAGLNPTELAAADLDGDGRLDLAAVNADENTVSIFRNVSVPGSLSAHSFAPRVDVPTGQQPVAIAIGDLDGDGRADIVTANHGDNTFSALWSLASPGNLTSNSFSRRLNFGAGAGPHSIALGDLNNDGRLDAVAGNFDAGTVSVLPNQPTPGDPLAGFTFGLRTDFPAGGRTVAIGDVDGDGAPDIVSGSWTANTISLLRKNPAISTTVITSNYFLPAVTLNNGGYTHNVALGDLDGDAKPDLAVVTEMPSQLLLYHNGTASGLLRAEDFSQRADLATGWNAVGVAVSDLDLDGRLDVVFANHYDDSVRIYRNATGTNATVRSFVGREFPKTLPPPPLGNRYVNLIANPAASVSVYSVEDQPPAGWTVGYISHGGVFDARTGKVKFGPFFDHEARTLTYSTEPPAGFVGVAIFSGVASADGVSSPIVGFDRMFIWGPHPADQPADWSLTISEVTGYGAAWRRGETWPVPPNPIPMDYVTRAGALWRSGECYQIDPSFDAAPMWWVSCAESNYPASPIRAALSAPNASTATRQAPTIFVAGEPVLVTIAATPARDAGAFAVEEQLPPRWTATEISHGGEFNAASGTVRWGPFLDAVGRAFTYRALAPVTASSVASFNGRASFDGASVAVAGVGELRLATRLAAGNFSASEQFSLQLEGPIGARYVIETSTDLINWTPSETVVNVTGQIEFTEPAEQKSGHRFYRARLLE